jgi:hypothetical protein
VAARPTSVAKARYASNVTSAHPLHYDYPDYLASLAASVLKLEYSRGVVHAIPGGTRAHAQLSAAVIVAFAGARPRTRRVATSDLEIRIDALDLSTFPDALVTCEARARRTPTPTLS